jgi:hypothetical protein
VLLIITCVDEHNIYVGENSICVGENDIFFGEYNICVG